MHELARWLGLTDASGSWYLWWSGVEGDITQLALLGTAVAFYRRRKCVTCWRIARHPVVGTAWATCHKHLTPKCHEHLHEQHHIKHPLQHTMLAQADQPEPPPGV